jgi:hypothetical protein
MLEVRSFPMVSARSEFADDVCPVRDELLGELCRANDVFVPGFVYTLAPDIRALLALFCYRRSHLHSIGLAIAASCDKDERVFAGDDEMVQEAPTAPLRSVDMALGLA